MRAAKLSAARDADAKRAASDCMKRVAEYRTDIAFSGAPDVRHTKEAAQWWSL